MNTMKTIFSFFLILLSAFLFYSCGDSSNTESTTVVEENAALSYADMELVDLDGNTVKLSDFKDKKVLVNFWATWCRPCIQEMPNLDNAKSILENEDYVFLSISDESIDKIENFAAKNPYGFTWLKLNQKVNEFEVYALPKTIVFDKSGNKLWEHDGIEEWDSPRMLEKLRAL